MTIPIWFNANCRCLRPLIYITLLHARESNEGGGRTTPRKEQSQSKNIELILIFELIKIAFL